MKHKLSTAFLVIGLIVILCTTLPLVSRTTDVSNVKATFDANTITVSSPEDNTFKLNIELKNNSKTSSWTSENLFINGVVPQTYDLETLIASYISQDAQITSVSVEPAIVKNNYVYLLLVDKIMVCGFGICVTILFFKSNKSNEES